jgi:hypothetical protein
MLYAVLAGNILWAQLCATWFEESEPEARIGFPLVPSSSDGTPRLPSPCCNRLAGMCGLPLVFQLWQSDGLFVPRPRIDFLSTFVDKRCYDHLDYLDLIHTGPVIFASWCGER